MNFEHNYLVFDEFGEKEILCMSCGKTIKSRAEVMSKMEPGMVIREMSKHADYREVPVSLSDGNISFIMVCDDCKFVDIRKEEAEKITNQIKNAFKTQMIWTGKTEDVIEATLNKVDRKVIRKAELEEVTAAMKGAI